MKLLITSLLLLLILNSAFAGSDIEYENSPHKAEATEKIHFKVIGDIGADKVCFNSERDEFKYIRPAFMKSVCEKPNFARTDSSKPIGCAKYKVVTVPKKTFLTSRIYQTINCLDYDRTDSNNTNCRYSELVDSEYSLEYKIKSYPAWDYRKEHGASYSNTKDIRDCDCV